MSKNTALPDIGELKAFIAQALSEDIGSGDITSALTIPEAAEAEMHFIARQALVVCGAFIPSLVYEQLDDAIQTHSLDEGIYVESGQVIAFAKGNARALLAGERVALNFMQRMSGVATLTRRYVDTVKNTKATILDTRKTIPGLRIFDKYATRIGGAQNHRFRLDDMVMIKDNHIVMSGGILKAVSAARAGCNLKIVLECDTLQQVAEAIEARPDRILLDNMTTEQLSAAVSIVNGLIPLEASGGVSLQTIRSIAETGVDYVSVGKLTHSAAAADIGADIVITAPS